MYNRLHCLQFYSFIGALSRGQTRQEWPVSWLARLFVNKFKISKPMTRCILITCATLLDF